MHPSLRCSATLFCLFSLMASAQDATAADAPPFIVPEAPPEATQDTYTQTRYPILLVPGAILFDLPVDAWSYWYGIVTGLQQGGAQVFVSRLPVGSDLVRGDLLIQEVLTVQALTGAAKVNLIGYSQGGQTCRYVAATRPELTASVTTVAAPHRGSVMADFLCNDKGAWYVTVAKQQLMRALDTLAKLMSIMPHKHEDFSQALAALTSEGAAEFNGLYPAGLPQTLCGEGEPERHGVRFYSWGGVGGMTNPLDPSDPLFLTAALLTTGNGDGMVARCSTHFGQVIRDNYRANHLDQVNQMFGLSAWQGVDPVAVFRTHANRLKNAGL